MSVRVGKRASRQDWKREAGTNPTNPMDMKESRLAEGCHMGFQGKMFIQDYSKVSGSGGRYDFVLTYGDCWVGGMFAKFRMYEQELSLTVVKFEVVVRHPPPDVINAGL